MWWAGRQNGGLKLSELADLSGVGYTAVADVIRRLKLRSKLDRVIGRGMEYVKRKCEL